MHEVPDQSPHNAVGALVHLGGLDDLLLHSAGGAPDAHQTRVLLPVRPCHEAGVVGAEGGGEHACTPRPVHGVELERSSEGSSCNVFVNQLLDDLDVPDGNDSLLLARVRDFWDRRDGPVIGLLVRGLDTAVVAVANGVNSGVALLVRAPNLALLRLDSQIHVHENPAAATWSLGTEGLLGHEIVGSLHTDADVLLVGLVGEFDLVPEFLVVGIVLGVVELLDALALHVLLAVVRRLGWQGSQALREEIDESKL
mmetsp:Transcript_66740/g.145000  ORF Transcript_66740/g.145000 Transcript_66740/m.145000 type:complete len:254 (+) Transcript_66740:254-1015(+)